MDKRFEAVNIDRNGSNEETSVVAAWIFDHLLRNDESYSQKWEYVRANPVRAGLVKRADKWPHQGEFVVIDRA